MSSKGYWLKPAGRTTAPRAWAAVVVRTEQASRDERPGRCRLDWRYAALATVSYRSDRWGSIRLETVMQPDDLHRRLEALVADRRSLWVVSPNASAALTLSRFWPRLVERGATWNGRGGFVPEGTTPAPPGRQLASRDFGEAHTSRDPSRSATDRYIVSTLVTRGKPDIVKYSVGGKTVCWVSGKQFFDCSEESLAATIGYGWPMTGGPVPVGSVVLRDPAERAELWLRTMIQVCDWWRAMDGGPWAATPGGLAMNYVRHRIKPKSILSHQQPEVRKLEEAALFGGRASTWFYGPVLARGRSDGDRPELSSGRPWAPVAGPAQLWDVSSMYPTILATRDFPVRIVGQWDRPSVGRLAELVREWETLAAVRLRSERAEYPHRHDARIVFPVGEYNAVLVGPELDRALTDGDVVTCYRAVCYTRGRPFAQPAKELIAARRKAADDRRPDWEAFIKLLSNSIGGKFAQRYNEWQRRPAVQAEKDWGEWMAVDPVSGLPRHFRSRAGLVDERVRVESPGRPLAACFAWLTAHGRLLMREIRELLPPRSVLSQDTDGIWVHGPAIDQFPAAAAHAGRRGFSLRIDTTVQAGRWYGPRHYWTDEGWTLSGIHDKHQWSDGLTFPDHYQSAPVSTRSELPPVWVYEYSRTARLGDIPVDGTVDAEGWTVPYRLRTGGD